MSSWIDPSNLHLKKELTQIRKAASRGLKDPGTSSTWRSPVNSARSHHYVHHQKNGIITSSQQFMQVESNANSISNNNSNGNGNGNAVSYKGNVNGKEKDKRVFLYNWRSHKSESERSRQNGEEERSSSSREESVDDEDMLSDARNGSGNDTKSETYLSDRYAAAATFNCKDGSFMPSTRRTVRKKSNRGNYSSASLKHQYDYKLQKKRLLSQYTKKTVSGSPGLGLRRDDSASVGVVDDSDDTGDYSNSEDLRKAYAISPLLARFKNKMGNTRKDDDSVSYSTPAMSTSSYNKYGLRNPSAVESWDAATGSFNDADDEVDDPLDMPGRQGCGIPCWSRRSTPKSRIGYGSCSPSLSETLRKGSSILCGSGKIYQKRRHYSFGSNKRRLNSRKVGQGHIPLLTNGSSVSGNSDDELSMNFGELDMEALSRLDGIRWSTSCRNEEGLELVSTNESSPDSIRSLSNKCRPMFFEEVIGQNLIVQSLTSAVSRGKIAPIYLFQGPRGTGKTSTARIFAAALNCLATEDTKPCGVCRECVDFVSGNKMRYVREVDGSNKKGIDKIKNLLKDLSVSCRSASMEYKVFVIDECHLLPSKMWLTFLRLLDKPLPRVVFVLVTTDIDNVPRALLSRCQKHLFNNIGNGDIVTRLRKIASEEKIDVELDALDLIASNADGSLRDAETMLDQLSLFGKRITVSLVNDLIGVVSDEKLLDLLELALSSNATETVIKARELMDLGVDPIVLMSQMATLIVDIIAGTYPISDANHDSSFFGGRQLSEREIGRLKHALNLLSEAEKHLRASSERSTWFTATLLQLGSVSSPDRTHSGSSRRQSSKATDEDHLSVSREATAPQKRIETHFVPEKSTSPTLFPTATHHNSTSNGIPGPLTESAKSDSNTNRDHSRILLDIWHQCIEKCHSKTLRQLLQTYGKLVLLSETKGGFIAHIAFGDGNIKTRAEGFLSSITNSFEIVLRQNVEIKIILLPESSFKMDKNIQENKSTRSNLSGGSDLRQEPSKESIDGNPNASTSKEKKSGVPVQRIESIIREQRLETAWLQAMEKGTPGSMSRLKPERNQVLPNESELVNGSDVPSQNWEDELNREMKVLKINGGVTPQKETVRRAMSPSLLHNKNFTSNLSKDNMGYESGSGVSGCNALFCWNGNKPRKRRTGKSGIPVRPRKAGGFSLFGACAKSKKDDNTYKK